MYLSAVAARGCGTSLYLFQHQGMTASDRPWMDSKRGCSFVVASAGPATVSVQRQLLIPSA